MKRYAAVIFDLDGVITDTAHYHHLAWKRLADAEGLPFDDSLNERLKGIDRSASLELILAATPRSYTQARKAELTDLKNGYYLELIANMTAVDLLPGAVEALSQVRAAGLRVGLASASRNALTVLDRLGIHASFDYVVDSATIANGKPDPEIFLAAASALGVAPQDCLGVEDAVAGVASIKSAGMTALGVGDPRVLTQADFVIAGLSQFSLSGCQSV